MKNSNNRSKSKSKSYSTSKDNGRSKSYSFKRKQKRKSSNKSERLQQSQAARKKVKNSQNPKRVRNRDFIPAHVDLNDLNNLEAWDEFESWDDAEYMMDERVRPLEESERRRELERGAVRSARSPSQGQAQHRTSSTVETNGSGPSVNHMTGQKSEAKVPKATSS